MEAKEARQQLLKLFGQQIRFNKDFDDYFAKLKDNMATDLLLWCERCKNNLELGSVPPRKQFKHLYVFFRKIASDVRVVLIKQQNNDFIEMILDSHKQYDDTRTKFGYKKNSYYGS